MKKILRVISPLFLTIPLFISCSKDYQTPTTSGRESEREMIELVADLEDFGKLPTLSSETGESLNESEARVFFDDQGQGNGVNFGYSEDEILKGVLFFKRGTATATTEVQFKVKANTEGTSRFKIERYKFDLPNNIARATGKLYISGAIGVIKVDESGKVSIPNPGILKSSQGYYSAPLYFPLTEIEVKPKSLLKTKFKLYGALIAFNAKNEYQTKYALKEISLTSKTFDTEGAINLNTSGVPTWQATQAETSIKTVELISRDNVVAANSSKPFVFWVKPTAKNIITSGSGKNDEFGLGFKSFTTTNKPNGYDVSRSESVFKIPVIKTLKDHVVHRIPELKVPEPGELIFTEIFRGADQRAIAIEVYNSSDVPVDLYDYKIRSYGPNQGTRESELLVIDDPQFRVMVDNTKNYSVLVGTSGKKISQAEATGRGYVLPPKHMALFITGKTVINIPYMRERRHLRYVFNVFKDDQKNAGYAIPDHGYIELIKKEKRTRTGRTREHIVDVFLKMTGKGGRQQHELGSYTMMRKPDRNIPRQTMLQGSNSDWISRYRTESIDWGYRFGFEYGNRPKSENNIWFDFLKHNRANGELETGGVPRLLTYLNTDPSNAGFLHSWEKGARTYYTVPTWWTRANGTAH